MTNLLTASGEIDPVAVQREAMKRAVAQRNRDWDKGVASSLAKIFWVQKAAVLRAAERDRDEAANRRRKLGMSLLDSAIEERNRQWERAMYGLAQPCDREECERLRQILNDLITQREAARALQAAE